MCFGDLFHRLNVYVQIKTDTPGVRTGPRFYWKKKNAGCTSNQKVIGSILLGRTRIFFLSRLLH